MLTLLCFQTVLALYFILQWAHHTIKEPCWKAAKRSAPVTSNLSYSKPMCWKSGKLVLLTQPHGLEDKSLNSQRRTVHSLHGEDTQFLKHKVKASKGMHRLKPTSSYPWSKDRWLGKALRLFRANARDRRRAPLGCTGREHCTLWLHLSSQDHRAL